MRDKSPRRRAIRYAAAVAFAIATSVASAQRPDRELRGKVMTGYQGWFRAEGDGSKSGWRHYTRRGKFEPGHCSVDLWPDTSEFESDERFATPFRHADGRIAEVFSSYHPRTVDRHFSWMKEYGIAGAFVQRFAVELRSLERDDRVLENCRAAAAAHDRVWALMYDLSGLRGGRVATIESDWQRLVDRGILDDPTYLQHQRRPLVAIWGVGFNDGREYSLRECRELVRFMQSKAGGRCAVMLGVPYHWREQRGDCVDDPELASILAEADVLSPWSVGRYSSPKEVRSRVQRHWRSDLARCHETSRFLVPVVFPGFSWHNLRAGKRELDQIPRLGGRFLWQQFVSAKAAGAETVYVAMFDEIDEATAIFKCTNDPPIGASPFLGYEDLAPDHYLWLTGQGARLLRGEREPTEQLPSRD